MLAVVAVYVARHQSPSLLTASATAGFAFVALWMFLSERYSLTLAVLLLYLGLLDGYVKLKTGSSTVTLARDVLLYAIALGLVARSVIRREPIELPPLSGWVLVFIGIVVVQLFNPGSATVNHGLPAIRPHLEFIPLFLLGYLIVTTPSRLRGFLVLLCVVAAVNGVVSLIQYNLTPDQLAAWGPGYAERINGTGGVSGRTFVDAAGGKHTRPFGLAGDAGQGGLFGLLALPGCLALLAGAARRKTLLLVVPLAAGVGLAIITSQTRTIVIGAFLALLAYIALTVISRRLVPAIASVVLVGLLVLGIGEFIGHSSQASGATSRLGSITPGKVVATTAQERGGSIAAGPKLAVRFPFGAGLGTVGPATGYGQHSRQLNGETEFNFLIVELGLPGLLFLLCFQFRILRLAMTRIRRIADNEVRTLLAAVAAPLFAMVAVYFSGVVTAGSPGSPYLWTASGVLVFWLLRGADEQPAPAEDQSTALHASPA